MDDRAELLGYELFDYRALADGVFQYVLQVADCAEPPLLLGRVQGGGDVRFDFARTVESVGVDLLEGVSQASLSEQRQGGPGSGR